MTFAHRQTRFPYSAILTFTELCHGDLFNILEMLKKLTWQQSRRWFTQITRALAYMHSEQTGLHSILHLDIKPENIMFEFPLDGLEVDEPTLLAHWDAITYKLGDFGTSAYLPRINDNEYNDTIHTVFGTEPYIAPELIQMFRTNGPPVQTKPCDVHSLGMTLTNTMMFSVAFNDVGDAGRMDLLIVYCCYGQAGEPLAGRLVREGIYKRHNRLIGPRVARLIHMMIDEQPQLRPHIEWVFGRD